MEPVQIDKLTDAGENYVYRDGSWITKSGYCVSTAHAHVLTMKFYEANGRPPFAPKKKKATRRRATAASAAAPATKAARTKAAAIRAAVNKALAAKAKTKK